MQRIKLVRRLSAAVFSLCGGCTIAIPGLGGISGEVPAAENPAEPSSFRLGGAVTGLAALGLQLQDAVGGQLNVGSDGVFWLPNRLPIGTAYDVSIAAQPQRPAQSCRIAAGKGTVGAGDVTSMQVNCTTDQHTVGGRVTGLAGTLVLQNQAGTALQVTSESFAFAPQASGSFYAVTVRTQPASPAQTCVVGRGVGIVDAADVQDIEVVCTTDAYAVGGRVLGLTGSGLVLRNNGGDDLAVAADASFVFATPVRTGAAYEVTVATAPSRPPQRCVVEAGSGIVGAGQVGSVVVRCAALDSCAALRAADASLPSGVYALDADGVGASPPYQAYCDMALNGGGWTLALNLDTSDGHVMWWAHPAWTDASVFGNLSQPFAQDTRGDAWSRLSAATAVMLVLHRQGAVLGFRAFRKAAAGTLQEIMQGGDNLLLGDRVLASQVSPTVATSERLVRSSSALYLNHCIQTGGNCTSGTGGSADGQRLASPESAPADNQGGGLGGWTDMASCCSGSFGSGKVCDGRAFVATAEAQIDPGVCGYGGSGFLGSDTYAPANPTCSVTNSCQTANFSAPSGLDYDYAIFLGG